MDRAYAILNVKAFEASGRKFSGVATTPEPDRIGDIIDPLGVTFKNPLPLFLFHDNHQPVGTVRFDKPTKDGVTFTAEIPDVSEAGEVKTLTDKAAHFVKYGLIRAVSVGFRAIDDSIERLKDGGLKFLKTEVLELSLVPVPANQDAVITTIKSICQQESSASGGRDGSVARPSARDRAPVVRASSDARAPMNKTINDRIKEFENTRATKVADRDGIQTKALDEGRTKDADEKQKFDTLTDEIKAIDAELTDLRVLDAENRAKAVETKGATTEEAARSRGTLPFIQIRQDIPPGIGLARVVICKMASHLSQGAMSPFEIAKTRYASDPRIALHFKATVAGGTTTDANWATELVEPTTLGSEFVEYLRKQTIIGKLNLKTLPFNVRIPRQTSGGTGYWVGEGAPKPLTSFAFDAVTLPYTKVAAIAVITQELARFSNPSAEALVRDQLAAACIERIDTDLIDPDKAVSSGVNPASLTNGVTALSSAGTSADNARTDIQNLLEQFILNNQNPANVVLVMPNTLALALSLMVNSLGQSEFPGLTMNGGTLLGIPVVTSQYAASGASYGNMVIAIDQSAVGLADDGRVDVDVSTQASLQMLDNPTNNSADGTATTMVSMFQTNSIAIRAERFIHWVKLRSTAVSFMDDVNWGSIGSPV